MFNRNIISDASFRISICVCYYFHFRSILIIRDSLVVQNCFLFSD